MMYGVPYYLLKKLKPSLTLHILPYFFHSLINYMYQYMYLYSLAKLRIALLFGRTWHFVYISQLIAVKKTPQK